MFVIPERQCKNVLQTKESDCWMILMNKLSSISKKLPRIVVLPEPMKRWYSFDGWILPISPQIYLSMDASLPTQPEL